MIAPVAGSGSWPSWIARVSKSIRSMLTSARGRPEARPGRRASRLARLPPEALDGERVRLPVEDGLDAADEPVAAEDRQDVVAVLPLRRPGRTSRGGSRSPRAPRCGRGRGSSRSNGERNVTRSGIGPSVGFGMRDEPAALEPHAERAEALLVVQSRRRLRARSSPSRDTSARRDPRRAACRGGRRRRPRRARRGSRASAPSGARPTSRVARARGGRVRLDLARQQRPALARAP